MRRRTIATAAKSATKAAPTPAGATSAAAAGVATHLQVEVTRAIDQELAWFFGYAETAHRLGVLTLVPPYLAAQIPAGPGAEEEATTRAKALLVTVGAAVRAVPTDSAGVLRAVYTPRRWPLTVTRDFGALAAVAVRLACAENPWPARRSHEGLEQAAARALAAGEAATSVFRTKARRLTGSAIGAYVRARSKQTASA